ncbi:Fe-S cluster assembly protein SufD [Teredinibacter haidensis]|uniref:Fe-S cluster assembly protein SufD n=1 Tax=Teredinibacter haidensis TaxID=2731755 RepID=UPI000948F1C8|nr:Fe-S cluster assembly protein SufD [Teredinibacter haidensis]
MSEFMQQAVEPLATGASAWLSDLNARGKDQWQAHRFPGRKAESWKYTNLRALEQGDFHRKGLPVVNESAWQEQVQIADLNAWQLVFVNGQYSEVLSSNLSVLPEGITLVRFSEASKEQRIQIRIKLDSVAIPEKHLFSALNAAQLQDGVFLRVEKNIQLQKPVQIVHINTLQDQAYTVHQRVLVEMEQGSEATIVEHFASGEDDQNSFTNGVTELCVGENARLHHYRLHLEHEAAIHVGSVNVALGRNANLNSFHLGLGGKIKRLDFVVNHQGEGAHCELNGVYLTHNSQHIDYHTCIEHAVPLCTTNEVFRGIVGDSSRAVFNGRIHIHPQAQKTLAQLSNKNLLTSNKAEVDTKPELEIYADDVQCAHGATIAQLDSTAMHYLRTRGVSEAEARVMLSFGFINELVNDIKHDAIAGHLRPMLVRMFARDDALMRHLV